MLKFRYIRKILYIKDSHLIFINVQDGEGGLQMSERKMEDYKCPKSKWSAIWRGVEKAARLSGCKIRRLDRKLMADK